MDLRERERFIQSDVFLSTKPKFHLLHWFIYVLVFRRFCINGMDEVWNIFVLHFFTLNISLCLVMTSSLVGLRGNIDLVWSFLAHALANLINSSFLLSERGFSPVTHNALL